LNRQVDDPRLSPARARGLSAARTRASRRSGAVDGRRVEAAIEEAGVGVGPAVDQRVGLAVNGVERVLAVLALEAVVARAALERVVAAVAVARLRAMERVARARELVATGRPPLRRRSRYDERSPARKQPAAGVSQMPTSRHDGRPMPGFAG